jgi:glycosyltransferase involved in cell wall biosynthesis
MSNPTGISRGRQRLAGIKKGTSMSSVSIILACHNVESYAAEALESLVHQSRFSEFEVIVVDDGSTDDTRRILQRYVNRYPEQIRLISFDLASGGPGKPRNIGLQHATAPFVIFMDPDDRVYEDGYSVLLTRMEELGSDMVIGTRFGVLAHAGVETRQWIDYETPNEILNASSYALRVDLLERRPVILKTIYRRSLIEEHNLRFLEGVSSSEDEIFDMSFITKSKTISKVNDVVYLYTTSRIDSITSNISLKVYRDLGLIMPALRDALTDYFGELVTSYRVAGLLRTFYFAKLRLLPPHEINEALDITRRVCADYGFDVLLKTQNGHDRLLLGLLRDGNYAALALHLDDVAMGNLRNRLRRSRAAQRVLKRRPVAFAVRASLMANQYKAALTDRALWRARVARKREGGFSQETNGYWVFMDRKDKASDNAEALYQYVESNRIHDRLAFILDKSSPDWSRLVARGFNLIEFNSKAHWKLLFGAELFLTSHCDVPLLNPWQKYGQGITKPLYKLIFLQHGVIRSDLSSWLGTKPFAVFCTSSRVEYNSILGNLNYRSSPDVLQLTGLARHDLLNREATAKHIVIAPTWRSFLVNATPSEFRSSEYFQAWSNLLHDEWLAELLNNADLHAKFVLHSNSEKFSDAFSTNSDRVEIFRYSEIPSFSDLLSHSAALVTDYSSISFDVAYLRRPIIYYMYPETREHDKNANADFGLYESIGTVVHNSSSLQQAMMGLATNNWNATEDQVRSIGEFFEFDDVHNCRRIIDAIARVTS